MLHCTYVVTTCDINKFVIIAARDSAVQRSRKTHVLALVPTLAALGFVGEARRKQLLPASAALPKGSGPGSRPAATSASRNHRAEVDRRADHQRARADRPHVFARYPPPIHKNFTQGSSTKPLSSKTFFGLSQH